MANKFTAELVEDFSTAVQTGIKYEDYQKIDRVRKQDIPDLRTFLNEQIRREPASTEWKRLLDTLTNLESSWKNGTLKIEKHKEESYSKTVEVTKKKLAELFGDIGSPQRPLGGRIVPAPTPEATTQSIPAPAIIVGTPIDAPVAPSTTPTATPTRSPTTPPENAEKSFGFNKKFLEDNRVKFDEIKVKLQADSNQSNLYGTLLSYIEYPDSTNAKELQKMLKVNNDGLFGPASFTALAKIAGVDYTKPAVAVRKKQKKQDTPNGSDDRNEGKRGPQPRDKNESAEKVNINSQIDEVIARMLTNPDFVASGYVMFGKGFIEDPFSTIIAPSRRGEFFEGDLQMSVDSTHAYEKILTEANLDAWRKLSSGDKKEIINAANKKWNERAQNEVNKKNGIVPKTTTTEKKDQTRESTEANRETIMAQATARMDEIIGNEVEFLKDFTDNKMGFKRVLQKPFSEVQVATKPGVIATDLQLKDNSFIPTAYEYILSGANLQAWRKMNVGGRTEVINKLNATWEIKSQRKIDEIEGRSKNTQRGTTGAMPDAQRGTTGAMPDAQRGTTGAMPDAQRGTTGAMPDAQRGTTGAMPDAQRGTTGAMPVAKK